MNQSPNDYIHAHHHAVQFYGNDRTLYTTVAGFLSEGLVAGQPGIIIATGSHGEAILEQLAVRLIDVEQARRIGDLVLLDARHTLETFMIGDIPDPGRFEYHIGAIIEQVLAGRTRTVIRAYREMVDLLWKEARTDAAIRLEMLWNKLATRYGFALLCGYSMGHFYKEVEQFQEICRQHTQVIQPDKIVAFPPKRSAKLA